MSNACLAVKVLLTVSQTIYVQNVWMYWNLFISLMIRVFPLNFLFPNKWLWSLLSYITRMVECCNFINPTILEFQELKLAIQ